MAFRGDTGLVSAEYLVFVDVKRLRQFSPDGWRGNPAEFFNPANVGLREIDIFRKLFLRQVLGTSRDQQAQIHEE